jgi:hypothetical protein
MAHDLRVDEVVSRARVERKEVVGVDRVLCPNARNGVEGDDRWNCCVVNRSGFGGLFLERHDDSHIPRTSSSRKSADSK